MHRVATAICTKEPEHAKTLHISSLQLQYFSMWKQDKCCLIISIIGKTMHCNSRSEKNWIRHVGQLVLDGLLAGSNWDKGAGSSQGNTYQRSQVTQTRLSKADSACNQFAQINQKQVTITEQRQSSTWGSISWSMKFSYFPLDQPTTSLFLTPKESSSKGS
jgi:hypothetical protein